MPDNITNAKPHLDDATYSVIGLYRLLMQVIIHGGNDTEGIIYIHGGKSIREVYYIKATTYKGTHTERGLHIKATAYVLHDFAMIDRPVYTRFF